MIMVDVMPQLLLVGLVGAAAIYGYKQMKREAARVVERSRRAEAEHRNGVQGTLVQGDDGVYRLKRD